jgi:ubiquinone biosynthesis protein UbiJ
MFNQPQASVNFSLPRLPGRSHGDAWPPPLQSWLPPGAVAEVHNRLVLLFNHVLRAEPAAVERLRPHAGCAVDCQLGQALLRLRVTPAGLLEARDEAEPAEAQAGTGLRLTARWPGATLPFLQAPTWQVEGDAAMAASFAWLADHLRWDVEADLARWIGPLAAGQLAMLATPLGSALRHMLRQRI